MTKSRHLLAPRRYWSEGDIALLRERYPHDSSDEIAAALGRPVATVYRKAAALGLRKTAEFYRSDRSGRVRRGKQDPKMRAHQFRAGQLPWNKGTSFTAGGRSAETRFKPGDKPHTRQPLGALRVTADGYLQRKVQETGYPPRDWEGVHRLVWMAAHGAIPAGGVVVFRPGTKTTAVEAITLDVLELLTRQELMQRNTVHRYGPQIASLVQLRGQLVRQINSKHKGKT